MNSSSCRAYLEDTVPAPGTRGAGCGDRGWLPGATVPTPPSWVDGSCRPCWGSARPPPFCFCIKGGEAFFFLGYIYTSQIRKCPNQIGQVATGNHSSKLFFFPFLSETPCRRKVNEMSVGCLVHTAAKSSFNTEGTKKTGTRLPPCPPWWIRICISLCESAGCEVDLNASCQNRMKPGFTGFCL